MQPEVYEGCVVISIRQMVYDKRLERLLSKWVCQGFCAIQF